MLEMIRALYTYLPDIHTYIYNNYMYIRRRWEAIIILRDSSQSSRNSQAVCNGFPYISTEEPTTK